MNTDYHPVLHFWFKETTPQQWFKADADFDQQVRQRFGALHRQAAQGELQAWRQHPHGRLAEIVVLDQFSRNIYRNQPQAFAQDAMALALAQETIAAKADEALTATERIFLYLPFMHSESKIIHIQAERLYRAQGLEENHAFEIKHKAIIDQFGRYPHRNAILGRPSTEAEIAFLQQPGSGF